MRYTWRPLHLPSAVRRLVAEGLAEPDLLALALALALALVPAPDRLLAVVDGNLRSDPGATLRAIGARLEAIRERTPRGGTTWRPGSAAHVVTRIARAAVPTSTEALVNPV